MFPVVLMLAMQVVTPCDTPKEPGIYILPPGCGIAGIPSKPKPHHHHKRKTRAGWVPCSDLDSSGLHGWCDRSLNPIRAQQYHPGDDPNRYIGFLNTKAGDDDTAPVFDGCDILMGRPGSNPCKAIYLTSKTCERKPDPTACRTYLSAPPHGWVGDYRELPEAK